MKIAIMGGTFNPVHYGHMRCAEEVREYLGFERIIFIPTNITPHKADEPVTPASARMEMLKLATSGNPGFEVSDMEVKRGGRSFTIDTVREVMNWPGSPAVSLIVGNDAFNDLRTWCDYETLITLASFIVVPRPGHPPKKPAEALPVELARKFWYDAETGGYLNSFGTSVTYLNTTVMDVSSSAIREMVSQGRSIRYLLPEGVASYIDEKGLYR